MSTEPDYHRLWQEPTYEGDILYQTFDWNNNKEASEMIEAAVKSQLEAKIYQKETWEEFESCLSEIKFKAFHDAKKWKKGQVREIIERFKVESFEPGLDEEEQERKQDEKMEFMIRCEDFWKKRDDPRRDKLFRKLHPIIFLKESLPPYVKI